MFAKKNLVAVAALLAVAGAAQAQSSVKLYGTVDMSVGSFETAHTKNDPTKAGYRTTKVESGQMMTSFFGLAGSEDLGGGLKAEFTLESFIGADTGANLTNNAGQFWSRGSSIALSGGFGKVAIGQYDNPLFTSGYTYNPFGSSMTFSPTMRHLSYLGQTPGGVGFDTGWVNSLTYESPVFSGFQAVAQYAPKETKAANTSDSYAVAGIYSAGPLGATLTYVKGGNTSTIPVTGGLDKNTVTGYFANQKVINLGASYDFVAVKAFVQYTSIKTSQNITSADAAGPTDAVLNTGLKDKTKIYQLGVSIPLSDKASVLASYGESKVKPTTGSSGKDRVFTLGYDYLLSKRTDVYGVFMNNGQTAKVAGQTFAVGVKHNF
jgi:predicted porin